MLWHFYILDWQYFEQTFFQWDSKFNKYYSTLSKINIKMYGAVWYGNTLKIWSSSQQFFWNNRYVSNFTMIRLENNKLLVPWNIIGTAISHDNSSKIILQHVSRMLGFGTNYETLVRFVQKYIELLSFKISLKTSLILQRSNRNNIYDDNVKNNLVINMAIFDNSQENFHARIYLTDVKAPFLY